MNIRKLEKEDTANFVALLKVFEVVFEMKDFSAPDQKHLQKVLNCDNFAVFIAENEGKIVGGLTTYVLNQYYDEKPLAYIFDLAVDHKFQRKGIGKKLVNATNLFYKEHGFEEVFVQVDKTDDDALDFYRKTSPSDENDVTHFNYQLN